MPHDYSNPNPNQEVQVVLPRNALDYGEMIVRSEENKPIFCQANPDCRNGICSDKMLHAFNEGIRKASIEIEISQQRISNMKECIADIERESVYKSAPSRMEYFTGRLELKNRLAEEEAALKDAVLRRFTMHQRRILYFHSKQQSLKKALNEFLTEHEQWELYDDSEINTVDFKACNVYLSKYLQMLSGKTNDELEGDCKITWCDCFFIEGSIYESGYGADRDAYISTDHKRTDDEESVYKTCL